MNLFNPIELVKKYNDKRTNVKIKRFNLCNVSHSKKFIFIHIPKNAGTTISKSLEINNSSHITAKEIKAQLTSREFKKYYKFCFVRNPWERFFSLYNYAKMEESDFHSAIHPEKAKYGKHSDYDLLKDASLEECAEYLVAGKLKHDKFWNQWQPQTTWVVDKRGKKIVDFIGRVETLNDDFATICAKINMPFKLPKHLNLSSPSRQHYATFYNEKTKAIIADYYESDIKMFGYQF